jgi:hypothetical protein
MTYKCYVMLICLSLWYRQLVACCDLHIGNSVCLPYSHDVSMLLYFSKSLSGGGGGDVFSFTHFSIPFMFSYVYSV